MMLNIIENQAKGWHGSYSVVGRYSAERYPMILNKDKILEDRVIKKKVKDYFSTEEDITKNQMIIEEAESIFDKEPKPKKPKKRKGQLCKPTKNEKKIIEEYKYHQIHHKQLEDYIESTKGIKKIILTACEPKYNLVEQRVIDGPEWGVLAGREKDFLSPKMEEYQTSANYYSKLIEDYGKKGVPMGYQTERGNLPIFYDLRIRTEKSPPKSPTESEVNKENLMDKFKKFYNNNNKSKRNEMTPIRLFEKNLSNYDYNLSKSNKFFIDNKEKNNSKSKSNSKGNTKKKTKNKKNEINDKNNHSIDFAKTFSREKYNFINRDRKGIHPFINPNYKLVEPKCITMVSYNTKPTGILTSKRVEAFDNNLFYNPDTVIDKVNNHKKPSAPNFKIMVSRENDTSVKLPLHMMKIHNRNCLYTMTEQSLKMNNFSDFENKTQYSSFNNKKSFNNVVNQELLKNSEPSEKKLQKFLKKIGKMNKIQNLMEFYNKNLDEDIIEYSGRKFDNITYKSIPMTAKLTKKEKEIFGVNFNDNSNK